MYMSSYRLSHSPDLAGWRFTLLRKGRLPFAKGSPAALSEWPGAAEAHTGVALLLSLLGAGEGAADGEALRLSHARVAGLTRPEAVRLGLPLVVPFTLFLSHDSPINDPAFSLRVQWFQRDGTSVFDIRREGTALIAGGASWLVLDPLYSVLEALDAVNAASGDPSPVGLDRRMAAYARFKGQLVRLTGDLRADEYLRGLTIHHATGLGIDLEPGDEAAPLLPTLYGDRPEDVSRAEAGDVGLDTAPVQEPLLPQHHGKMFHERFLGQGARSHYVLGQGVYAVLDAPVAAALAVLERVNRADPEARRAFRQDPLACLAPEIEAAGGEAGVVCNLRGFGPRVIGVGDWVPPSLSFPLPVARDWFPGEEAESFTIAIPGESPLTFGRDEIGPLKQEVAKAQAAGEATCLFQDRALTLTSELVETVHGLAERLEPGPRGGDGPDQTERAPRGAALTRDNEEQLTYLAEQRSALGRLVPALPSPLSTAPKPHQVDGIDWLQKGYIAGAPGLLLADDMGLGKTYEVLALLLWLRQAVPGRLLGPVLIVAPKTLLGNWCDELALHLGSGALGRELHAYERGLQELRLERGGNDTTLRRQTLDVDRIKGADLVLTTYETLRDYQISFAKVPFAVVVFDEAQKIKNPASLMNRGAKAQQGRFTLLMTGTPIENSVLDLWTLLDIAWPGFLGLSARDFLGRYGADDAGTRAELKQRITEPPASADPARSVPPIMLRRFKEDLLEGLPERRVEATADPMPPEQQAAYDAVRAEIRERPQGTLAGLQRLRAVCLHPRLSQPPESAAEDGPFIAASARFKRLFEILDRVHVKREKALIFVELREAQRALYDLIRRRYRLPAPLPETINGATAAQVRDRIRHAFQERRGFDVLILGPKAAGFGLTLTAANHVIHLNRWWNPAVEDQCSDRVYRIGQGKPVTIYLPQAIHPDLGEQSFDSLLHGLLEEKRTLSREVVAPVQFSDQDLRGLFAGSLGEDAPGSGAAVGIDNLDWRGFELWVADQLQGAGFAVEITPGRGDGGVDVIGTLPGRRTRPVFVQCKHTGRGEAGRCDEAAVQDLLRARKNQRHRYLDPILAAVTNGRFALAAENLALEVGATLFDGTRLTALGPTLAALADPHTRRPIAPS